MSQSTKPKAEIDEAAMRAMGLVPRTIWLPDVDAPGFREECERQSRIAAASDAADPELLNFMEAVLEDMELPPYEAE